MALSLQQPQQNDPADWFLISGGLSIRLKQPVTFGVDKNRVMQIDSKNPAERWLTLEIAADGKSVEITWLDESLELRNTKPEEAAPTLTQGTLLRLPHNEVYISRSLQRGKRLQLIEIAHRRVTAPIEPIGEPVKQPQAKTALTAKPEPTIKATPTKNPEPTIVTASVDKHERTKPNEGSIVPPSNNATAPIQATKKDSNPNNRISWGAVALVVAALVLWQLYATGTLERVTDRLLAETETTRTIGQGEPVLTAEPTLAAETTLAAEPSLAAEPTNDRVFTPISNDLIEPASAREANSQAALVNEAQALFDQGYYTWPKPSAADKLDEVLGINPNNTDALALRDQMAAILIAKAQEAYTEGFYDSARDQVKAVLAFHRNHGPAVDLLIQWDLERLARNLERRN